MIVSGNKPFEEIMEFLKEHKSVFILGCKRCATVCKSGGEEQVNEMKELLEKEGKKVTGTLILDPGCTLSKTKKDLNKYSDIIENTDALLSMACGDGTQTVAKIIEDKPVYPANDTLFIGEAQMLGRYEEACRACGECQLGWTGGICPVTSCAKGLLNGACGGADKNGKCEVNPEMSCAWIKIYKRLERINQLDNLLMIRDERDYSKLNRKRDIKMKDMNTRR
ncbi:5,10-methylenetetrahydrofolate reductase [Peptacetobacter hominis]|uniref:5,10-methylenetetrahydrofolate reductase n=1 Tax=Peptacetobacter hominis TaxID=2743610 RepID=A0A544QW42_9FIRM|nr:methylenetetrahydrofolate reductase C-terminal domain-containing protein [Peptacetobacter hominis]TQQ84913.1 5,10-methylenetetrahydrofolate reductase [Peptacetobacter hominis]